jgi:hypothetical protein
VPAAVVNDVRITLLEVPQPARRRPCEDLHTVSVDGLAASEPCPAVLVAEIDARRFRSKASYVEIIAGRNIKHATSPVIDPQIAIEREDVFRAARRRGNN